MNVQEDNVKPLLTIISVAYNSADFFHTSLKALLRLTKNPWKLYICDNGSSCRGFFRLRHITSNFENVFLFAREQKSFGSMGHGEALNVLSQFIDTPYGVVMDADCFPLIRDWDELFITQLDDKHKIIGTPLAQNTPETCKPKDFPLIFLTLFETEIFKRLKIDFRPKDMSLFQDTGWELREKYLKSGFKGQSLFGLNTRLFKQGSFAETICNEYYLDETLEHLFCSHFGRGSNPSSGKYGKNLLGRFIDRIYHKKDKRHWLSICEHIIDEQSIPKAE